MTSILKSKCALLFVLICLLTGLPLFKAHAAPDMSVETLVGFAFFKFAKVEPDFKSWVKNSSAYQSGSPRERVDMLRNQVPLLENQFANHVIEDNPIVITTNVRFPIPRGGGVQKMINRDGAVTVDLKLESENGGFFAIPVSDLWVALIPRDLDYYLTLKFTGEEYDKFRKALSDKGVSGQNALLKMRLIPFKVDTNAPLQVGGYDLWMMMANIVSFEIWSRNQGALVWSMNIPDSDRYNINKEIYGLYEN